MKIIATGTNLTGDSVVCLGEQGGSRVNIRNDYTEETLGSLEDEALVWGERCGLKLVV